MMFCKLVRKDGDRYYSFNRPPGFDGSIEYKVGEPTYPKYGKLFVFDTPDSARKFLKSIGQRPIDDGTETCLFLCGCDNAQRGTYMSYNNEYQRFWETINSLWMNGINVPAGTYFADSLTLLEEISIV